MLPAATLISPDLTDLSWLNDQPCQSPCWYGLMVGETFSDIADTVIPTLTFLDPTSKQVSGAGYWVYPATQVFDADLITYECKQPGYICVAFSIVDDQLVQIILVPNYHVTFQEVVDKIGPPDYVRTRPLAPEIIDCSLVLTWVDRQLSITYYERLKEAGRDLCKIVKDAGMKPLPSLPVHEVLIDMPDKVQGEILGNDDQPWNGFQEEGE